MSPAPHLEESLQRSIDLIQSKVQEMAELAERALKTSLQALVERNLQLAYSVVLRDQYIDERETELNRICLEFLVRQQPVAGHLRFIFTAIQLNKELERIGDYAESIARQALVVAPLDPPPPNEKIVELAQLSIHMFHDAVQAFLTQDADLARRTMGIEDRADHLRHQINDDLLLWRQEERIPLEAYTPLGTIARRFERVTDQSKNICEEILYMCTGEFLKHKGADAFRVLFVDADNACLSQMAEALGRSLNLPRIVFTSAGLAPTEVAPEMVRFLSDKGLAVGPGTTQALDQVQDREHYQVMVALAESCRKAFPPRPTKTVCLVWPLADPRTVSGSAAQVHAAFEEAYRFLDRHIRDLVEALQGAQESTPSL